MYNVLRIRNKKKKMDKIFNIKIYNIDTICVKIIKNNSIFIILSCYSD